MLYCTLGMFRVPQEPKKNLRPCLPQMVEQKTIIPIVPRKQNWGNVLFVFPEDMLIQTLFV